MGRVVNTTVEIATARESGEIFRFLDSTGVLVLQSSGIKNAKPSIQAKIKSQEQRAQR